VCKKQFDAKTDEFICAECKQKAYKECKICGILTLQVKMTSGVCEQCKRNLDFGLRFEPATKVWMNREKAKLLGFDFEKDLIGLDNLSDM